MTHAHASSSSSSSSSATWWPFGSWSTPAVEKRTNTAVAALPARFEAPLGKQWPQLLTRVLSADDSPTHRCRARLAARLVEGGVKSCLDQDTAHGYALIATRCLLETTGRAEAFPLPTACSGSDTRETCIRSMSEEQFRVLTEYTVEAERLCREITHERWQESVEQLVTVLHDSAKDVRRDVAEVAEEVNALHSRTERVQTSLESMDKRQTHRDLATLKRLARLLSRADDVEASLGKARRDIGAVDLLLRSLNVPRLIELVEQGREGLLGTGERVLRGVGFYALLMAIFRAMQSMAQTGTDGARVQRIAVVFFASSLLVELVVLRPLLAGVLAWRPAQVDMVVDCCRATHLIFAQVALCAPQCFCRGTAGAYTDEGDLGGEIVEGCDMIENDDDTDPPSASVKELLGDLSRAIILGQIGRINEWLPSQRLQKILETPPPGYRRVAAHGDVSAADRSSRWRTPMQRLGADDSDDDDAMVGCFAKVDGVDRAHAIESID